VTSNGFVIPPPPTTSLPCCTGDHFPVRRIYCIGRNYAAHAVEMGHDPDREAPFFFQKNPQNAYCGETFPYPDNSTDLHHEVELVAALASGGIDVPVERAMKHVWGFGIGLDMTRRDLQSEMKAKGRPWEIGKAFEHSAPMGPLCPISQIGPMEQGDITLSVNGDRRQSGNLDQMIWKLPEQIAHLSRYYELSAGDLIFTGTPSGVGPVARGDRLRAEIDGLPALEIRVI